MWLEIRLPELGENVTGGDVVNVLVEVGQAVEAGEDLLELETDKALIPVPSPEAGTIEKLLVEPGDHIEVGQVIAELAPGAGGARASQEPVQQERAAGKIEEKREEKPKREPEPQREEEAEAKPPAKTEAKPPAKTEPASATPEPAGRDELPIPAAPATRALARDLGVDLRSVEGTAAGGRITREDVAAWVRQRLTSGAPASARAEEPEREEVKVSSLRRKIGEQMAAAWRTIPHVTQFDEADTTDLEAVRQEYKDEFRSAGARLTTTAFIIKAVTVVLREMPQFNSRLGAEGATLIVEKHLNVGVAVDTPEGLIVPVIHRADRLSLFELALTLEDLGERTRARKVRLEELQGGTFTVSNLGGIGGTGFTPIINPPQVAILGIARGSTRPSWNGEAFEPRMMTPLCLSYDHRVIDGADAVRFTRRLAELLEQPTRLFLFS